jgi:hypothetical protein
MSDFSNRKKHFPVIFLRFRLKLRASSVKQGVWAGFDRYLGPWFEMRRGRFF